MAHTDEYLTVEKSGVAEIKVKGSRFIASVAPVRSEKAARAFVERINRRYHDATHNCFAYRVGIGDQTVIRTGDAGEPPGTAGRPILEAIGGRDLTDVALVVTRYFGGTKLGTGGLARSYQDAARRALDAAGAIRKILTEKFSLSFPYDLTKDVRKAVDKHAARIVDEQYGQEVKFRLAVRQSRARAFREQVGRLGKGRVLIERR